MSSAYQEFLENFEYLPNEVKRNLLLMRELEDRCEGIFSHFLYSFQLELKTLKNEKKKEITRLEFQSEFDRKKDSLNLVQQITDGKLHQQVLLAKQQQQELVINKNQLALSEKEIDLQRLAYLKTQADLQNEQLQKQEKDKQLTLTEKEKQLQSVHLQLQIDSNHSSFLNFTYTVLYCIKQ